MSESLKVKAILVYLKIDVSSTENDGGFKQPEFSFICM
jgi:hypothetical protein